MKTVKFHKTECGVEVLLNVLHGDMLSERYLERDTYNTDFFEILLFKTAKGSLILNQQKIDIRDNTIVFISPFQKRQWTLEKEGLDYTVLVFQENFLNDFFSDKFFTYRLLYFYQLNYPLNISIEKEELQKALGQLMEIKYELVNSKTDSIHIIRSLTYYLLLKFNRIYANANNLSIDRAENNFAYQFKQLLEIHIRQKQRIDYYADLLNVSRITINTCVKKQFNVTATELIKQRLLFEIKNDLIHSGKTIAEIAYDLHFSEPGHMMRFFKTQTGITSSQFLSDYQNGIFS
ncbi:MULTISPECIES: AraC family transcriptional regulator [unclassified Flavobacterium]|jgi:AraC family transcriptional activator of pobA|uniref:helix-turn-helix domain-containing protein n=1 Tax=unclassified Flavobacterium TaxID=196869 RepID=UPI00057D4A05|nr:MULTISPECIES: helix-turn-helix domain-containing protein [unclassified Flavobacterium]KIA93621.1 AraC family transcriptional regulator [Flavobacterium sp. KMS]MEA9412827.1 helix-turn-helix domain-containing protein [Flavobacterium sp. PL02]OUL62000.1 AraC family transcriptional regulator [Flavobacterium sp. AJR]